MKMLKSNKTPSSDHVNNDDHVNNESISKLTRSLLLHVKLFDLVFDIDLVPDNWLLEIIQPIYKGKGDRSQPEN